MSIEMGRLDMSTRIHIFHGYGRSAGCKIEISPLCLSLDHCRIHSGDKKITTMNVSLCFECISIPSLVELRIKSIIVLPSIKVSIDNSYLNIIT